MNGVGCLLRIVPSAAESLMILSTKGFTAAMHSDQLELVLHGRLMPASHGRCRKELIYSDTETPTLAFEVPDSWNKIRFRRKKNRNNHDNNNNNKNGFVAVIWPLFTQNTDVTEKNNNKRARSGTATS